MLHCVLACLLNQILFELFGGLFSIMSHGRRHVLTVWAPVRAKKGGGKGDWWSMRLYCHSWDWEYLSIPISHPHLHSHSYPNPNPQSQSLDNKEFPLDIDLSGFT